MVEVNITADDDGLLAGATTAIVMVVAIANIGFDDDYIVVGVNADVVVVYDTGVPAVVHIDV